METEKTYRKHTHTHTHTHGITIEIVLHRHKKQKESKTCLVYFYQALLLPIMDHFPIRQTFEFGNSWKEHPTFHTIVKFGFKIFQNVENTAP